MKQFKKDHCPSVLTIDERAEVVAAVKEGLAQAERGEGISLTQFDKYMRNKYGIPH